MMDTITKTIKIPITGQKQENPKLLKIRMVFNIAKWVSAGS
jgi:hypothetical protein